MKKAFTLIELMVTIAIIAILTVVATVSYNSIQQRSRDSQRQNDLNQLKLGLTTYYHAQTVFVYPTAANKTNLTNTTGGVLFDALCPAYIRAIPLDPKNTGDYIYKYQSFSSAKDYTLYATLENVNNTKGWGGGTQWVVDGYQLKPD